MKIKGGHNITAIKYGNIGATRNEESRKQKVQ